MHIIAVGHRCTAPLLQRKAGDGIANHTNRTQEQSSCPKSAARTPVRELVSRMPQWTTGLLTDPRPRIMTGEEPMQMVQPQTPARTPRTGANA